MGAHRGYRGKSEGTRRGETPCGTLVSMREGEMSAISERLLAGALFLDYPKDFFGFWEIFPVFLRHAALHCL